MKRIIAILILIVASSCSTTKKFRELNAKSLEKEFKNHSLVIPETWYSYIESHGLLFHSPKKLQRQGEIYYSNRITVFNEQTTKNIEAVLQDYLTEKKKKNTGFNHKSIELNHKIYGKYYVVKYLSTWNGINYTHSDFIFKYKNQQFRIDYSSFSKYYYEYIKDVFEMINSFKIKETI